MDAIEKLVKRLNSKDHDVRRSAADALRQIGRHAVEPLIGKLYDNNPDVRGSAAYALARVGGPAVGPLLELLKGKKRIIIQSAADALGRIGDPRAVEPLNKKINTNHIDNRRSAADTQEQIGGPAVGPLLELLNSNRRVVVHAAAYALGRIGDPRAVEPLLKKLNDKELEVRLFAGYALDEITDAKKSVP